MGMVKTSSWDSPERTWREERKGEERRGEERRGEERRGERGQERRKRSE